MKRRPLLPFAVVLFGTIACLGERPVRAAPADEDRAKALLREGNALFAKGETTQAEAKLKEAWQLKQTADIAANLGGVELELKEYDLAAAHLAYAERNLPVSTAKAQRQALDAQFAEAKKHVGALSIEVSATGAEVDVDGESEGLAPLDHPVFVKPGSHKILAKRDGLATKEVVATVKEGDEQTARIVLEVATPLAPATPAPSSTPSPVAPADAAPHRSPVPGGVLIGIGAVTTIVGGTLLGLTALKDAEAHQLGKDLTCAPTRMDAGCADLQSVVNTRNDFVVTGGISTGVGLALLVSGIAYLAWPQPAPGGAKVVIAPAISNHSGALVVGGVL